MNIVSIDQQLFLLLNGSESTFLDVVFTDITRTITWVPMLVLLLLGIARGRSWRQTLFFVVGAALVVLIADRFSSGLCKPFFHRLRPSHEPSLQGVVDLVDGYSGGMYGFISSHAANTFGIATFTALCLRHNSPNFHFSFLNSQFPIALTMFAWALLSSYSRIYLGVHYPGDILAGALAGCLIAFIVYAIMRWLTAHLNSQFSILNPPSLRPSSERALSILERHTPTLFLLTLAVILVHALVVS